jgi:hypothetical protein
MRSFGTFSWRSAAVAITLPLAFLASPAFADVGNCVSGNLAGIEGATCDIGYLQFTFSAFSAENYSVDNSSQNTTYGTQWMASFFTFTVLSDGFELSGPPPQSVTAPSSGSATDFAFLNYSVTDLDGEITGVGVSGGTPSVSGTDFSNADNYLSLSNSSTVQEAYNELTQMSGTIFNNLGYSASGGPISSGSGSAYPFSLSAYDGSSASISSTNTSFIFGTSVPQPSVPEPSGLILLGVSLLGVPGMRLCRRLFRRDRA